MDKGKTVPKGSLSGGRAAIANWYSGQCLGDSPSANCRFEDQEDGSVWVTLVLGQTEFAGLRIEPFVVDFGSGVWLQGWADGELLTLCSPSEHLAAAAGYLRLLTASALTPGVATPVAEGGVPDGSELPG